MPAWKTYRTVVRDGPAEAFLRQNAVPGERFDDQWRGIEWLICRTPEIGLPRDKEQAGKFNLLVFAASDVAKTREVWVLYSYEDDEVTVHAIKFADG